MKTSKNAFTMIELVFVIVILGILSAVAIPKFAATRSDAEIANARAFISSVRASILNDRNSRVILGDNKFIDGNKFNDGDRLFAGVLDYPIDPKQTSAKWGWTRGSETTDKVVMNFTMSNTAVPFTYYRKKTTVGAIDYNAGVFVCDSKKTGSTVQNYCWQLTH